MQRGPRGGDRGAGVIGTAFGASAFLAFLLLATHTLLSLYATSIVTSHAWDTAKSIAGRDGAAANDDAATAALRHELDGFDNVKVEVDRNASEVRVHVQVDRPMFLPAALARRSGLGPIDEVAQARIEQWR